MRRLICYVTGGLGNRVLPLASFIEFAKRSDRELFVYWPLDFRCGAHFSELYSDELLFVDDSFLAALPVINTQIFCRFDDGVTNDYTIYNRNYLWNARAGGRLVIGEPTVDNEVENLVCCTNTFLSCIPEKDCEEAVRKLQIKRDIIEDANKIALSLGLNKNILGVHLRGTDYNLSPSHYAQMIHSEMPDYSFDSLFFCSDDSTYEEHMDSLFPNSLRRKNKVYITKGNEDKGGWTHNTDTTPESLRDALIDIVLLAKTNFKIYNKTSTFAEYARILSHE